MDDTTQATPPRLTARERRQIEDTRRAALLLAGTRPEALEQIAADLEAKLEAGEFSPADEPEKHIPGLVEGLRQLARTARAMKMN